MAKKAVPFRIDEDLLRRVDEARGDVPRTRWVTRAIEAALNVRPAPLSALGPNPSFEAVKASAAEAQDREPLKRVFDAHTAALERQRKLNEGKAGR